jgi:hypothetical protein
LESLNLGEVLVWKQEILSNFLTDYLVEIGKECKEKADILLFAWNSTFNIIEYLIEVNSKLASKEEKEHLNQLIANHQDYQSVIESLKQKMAKKEKTYL